MRKVALIGLIALATSCGSKKAMTYMNQEESTFSFYTESTACFGSCPIYTLSIDESGKAEYIGSRFVEAIGNRAAQLPQSEIDSLKLVLIQNDFFGLDSIYDNKLITDLPSFIVKVKPTGFKGKQVIGRYEYPEGLERIKEFIERLRKRNFKK